MPFSRRSFLASLGAGGLATVAAPAIFARGHEALAAGVPDPLLAGLSGADPLRLHSNENPLGPGERVLTAIRDALGTTSLYPAGEEAITATLATQLGVQPENILLGAGSTETLRVAVDAFTGPGRALVTGLPSFETPVNRASALGVEVRAVPVDADLRLNLDGMLHRSSGAGLVFFCNPNNPTATVHGAAKVQAFIEAVHRVSPMTIVLVDEAYHHYVGASDYATAIPLALADPRVVVARTFSKAYGMAGLRVGFAVGRPETLARMGRLPMALGGLTIAAAQAALQTTAADLERERRRNSQARAYLTDSLNSAGYRVAPADANFLMADIRRPIADYRNACRARGVLVGRPFPPLDTHVRISIGTIEEMRFAMPILMAALDEVPATRAW